MTHLSLFKHLLFRGLSPFLVHRPQKRVVIFHEVMPEEHLVFERFLKRIRSERKLEVLLTFDDGFSSSCKAIRQLSDHKAIFFICPNFINAAGQPTAWENFFHHNLLRTEVLDRGELRDAVAPAGWDDLRELVKLGHSIGSHGLNHRRLSTLTSHKELEREIIGSADMIEDQLGVAVDSFSYPFGDYQSLDARAYRIIERRYTRCFSGLRGNNLARITEGLWWRDTIHLSWPVDYMLFLLQGGFDWAYWKKRQTLVSL